jgi:hypothetical protein
VGSKEYEIGICCFSAKQAAVRGKGKARIKYVKDETLTFTPPMWVVLPQKKNNLCSNFNLDTQNRKNHTYQ